MLPPFLFTLYTADVSGDSNLSHPHKRYDDSAIASRISEEVEREDRRLLLKCVECCEQNHLPLNTDEAKELGVISGEHPGLGH